MIIMINDNDNNNKLRTRPDFSENISTVNTIFFSGGIIHTSGKKLIVINNTIAQKCRLSVLSVQSDCCFLTMSFATANSRRLLH